MPTQSLYIGPDWIMYAGPDGYERSQMLSAAILLGEPGKPLLCQFSGGELSASCLLHPAGMWSTVSAAPFIVIYLDPMSTSGRKIQCGSGSPRSSAQVLERLPNYAEDFDRICRADFSAHDATLFTAALRTGIEATGARQMEDPRLECVARALSENPVGRLDLKRLAGMVGFSADYLRHLFKQQTGITLSKYKTWNQLHVMLCQIVRTQGPIYNWNTHESLQSAGFYDDSHGYRTIAQYFGPQRSMADKKLLLVNCLA